MAASYLLAIVFVAREREVHQDLVEKMAHLVEKEYLECQVPQEWRLADETREQMHWLKWYYVR